MRIAIAQLNLHVGNIDANKDKIIKCIIDARDNKNAQLIIFPELALTAYPPEDLLLRPALYHQLEQAILEIKSQSDNIDTIISYPDKQQTGLYNACSYLSRGKIQAIYHKKNLPNYGVFDEKRYFQEGKSNCMVDLNGIPAALSICEDLWMPEHAKQASEAGAKILININASPYHADRVTEREFLLKKRVEETGLSIIYINLVGGQDELIFDGGSMVIDKTGEFVFRAPQFEEGIYLLDLTNEGENLQFRSNQTQHAVLGREAGIYQAIVLGVRDYVRKNGFEGVIIGLSGGVDSALTLSIAVDALGPENVEVLLMPSRYTADISIDDSKAMAKILGVNYEIISIEKPFAAFTDVLSPIFADLPVDTTEENIQARCRGILLMAVSNKCGKLVLTTGNKSELAVGYATLYGDMAGGYAPLKDVWKTLVYRLAKWRNRQQQVIPERVISRPPTAELRHDQLDQDSLPDYETLDPILEQYIELDMHPEQIIKNGFDADTVYKVIGLVDRNEYKRRQAAPGIRITERAFGRDRRYPISSGYRERK